jgi:hypothetical protein
MPVSVDEAGKDEPSGYVDHFRVSVRSREPWAEFSDLIVLEKDIADCDVALDSSIVTMYEFRKSTSPGMKYAPFVLGNIEVTRQNADWPVPELAQNNVSAVSAMLPALHITYARMESYENRWSSPRWPGGFYRNREKAELQRGCERAFYFTGGCQSLNREPGEAVGVAAVRAHNETGRAHK